MLTRPLQTCLCLLWRCLSPVFLNSSFWSLSMPPQHPCDVNWVHVLWFEPECSSNRKFYHREWSPCLSQTLDTSPKWQQVKQKIELFSRHRIFNQLMFVIIDAAKLSAVPCGVLAKACSSWQVGFKPWYFSDPDLCCCCLASISWSCWLGCSVDRLARLKGHRHWQLFRSNSLKHYPTWLHCRYYRYIFTFDQEAIKWYLL